MNHTANTIKQLNIEDSEQEDHGLYMISDLVKYLESYLNKDEIKHLYRSYLFAADAHVNQKRQSGEHYIYHPIAVARILAGMHLDYRCLMAAILHDVIEDTSRAKNELIDEFGQEVANLVDGVTKLTHLDFGSKEEAQAASFRKMILAITKDIRVVLIKLADRLHNMRTLGAVKPRKARRVARETLEIYAPIAQRLGINRIRLELEDLAFKVHYPWRYRILQKEGQRIHGAHKKVVEGIITRIRQQIISHNINADVQGRRKALYSIYRKVKYRKVDFHDITDVFGFRIITQSVDDCYRILGIVHYLFKPMPGRFKDYIAIPKTNGYQSLHTVLFGPNASPIEVQIRTETMHHYSEHGIASHWLYKHKGDDESGSDRQGPSNEWLKSLKELQKGSATPIEFLEHVKVDLFPTEVYVFTPHGKIITLPRGATVIDFAYAVHTDIGNHCVAARVNKRMVPLRYRLHNGETVEIHMSENSHPSPRWLEFVVTSKARANIRSYLKLMQGHEAINLGAHMLGRELAYYNKTIEHFDKTDIDRLIAKLGHKDFNQLLMDIAMGNRPARFVARHLIEENTEGKELFDRESSQKVSIKGTEGMVVKYSRCCFPIPGDAVVGTFNPGKGIVIHRVNCRNITNDKRADENWVDVEWADDVDGTYLVALRTEVKNKPGVLANTSSTIAANNANIESVIAEVKDGYHSIQDFVISVKDRKHLADILRSIRNIPDVLRISRRSG